MHLSRAVLIGVFGGALVAWFAGASTSGTRPVPVFTAPRSSAVDKTSAELADEIDRLHERLHPTAVPGQPARNLFDYGARVPRATTPSVSAAAASPVLPPAPAGASGASAHAPVPALALIGIAEDAGVRTAIISGAGELAIVKEGEHVGPFTVVRIDGSSADLSGADAGPLHLTLK